MTPEHDATEFFTPNAEFKQVKDWVKDRRDANRCAVCGWHLADIPSKGCVRGNCSLRPFPDHFYDPARAKAEYSPYLDNHPAILALAVSREGAARSEAPVRASGEPQNHLLIIKRVVVEMLNIYGITFTDANSRDIAVDSWAWQFAVAATSPSDAGARPPQDAKDISEIVSSYGFLLMRLAVTEGAQDTYDVCKREFQEHEAALKRLQDFYLRGGSHGQDAGIGRRANHSDDATADAGDRAGLSASVEPAYLPDHRAGLRAGADQLAPTTHAAGAVRSDAGGGVRLDVTPAAVSDVGAAPQAAERPQRCQWTLEINGEYYDTQCGQAFVMLDGGTPSEHKMQFCAYCGRELSTDPVAGSIPEGETPQ